MLTLANEWKASAVMAGSGWSAVVKRVDKAEPYRLMTESSPKCVRIFPTEMAARLAAAEHLIWLWNHELRFDIQKPSLTARSLEEQAFGTVSSKKGKATVKRRQQRKRAQERRRSAG